MAGRVQGKVAVVVGGSSGVGRATSTLLASEGAKVVVANRTEETGNRVVGRIREAGGDAIFVRTDMSQEADCVRCVRTAVETFGGLDVLVNAAAMFPRANLLQTTEEFWDQMMNSVLKGPFLMCKHAIPEIQKRGGGSIINVGSIEGLCGQPELFSYATAKGGLLTMTRNLARAYARDQIRANYVIPGWVASEGELARLAALGRDLAWMEERGRSAVPMGRVQVPEDAARAILFLASDDSNQVTGAIINTDGGRSTLLGA